MRQTSSGGGLFALTLKQPSTNFGWELVDTYPSSLIPHWDDSEVHSTESPRGLQEEWTSVAHSNTCSLKHPILPFFPFLSHFPAALTVLPGITSPVSLFHSDCYVRIFFQETLRSDLGKTLGRSMDLVAEREVNERAGWCFRFKRPPQSWSLKQAQWL